MEKVLLVGSGGFLGSAVKEKIINQKNFHLTLISGKDELDITNIELLDEFVYENSPDYLINCAAFVGGVSYGYKFQRKLLEENVKMALNIYDVATRNKIKKIINPISNCVYPASLTEYREENILDGPPHESVYYYAKAKRFLIDLSNAYFLNENMISNNLILSNMYGPNDHFEPDRSHALGALIKKIYDGYENNTSVEIWGSGKQEREWLYVYDGAESILRSLNKNIGHKTFNIGVNKTVSINDLAFIIAKEIGFEGKFKYNMEMPEGVFKKSIDGKLGSQILNWSPEIDLKEGIKQTVMWYKKHYG